MAFPQLVVDASGSMGGSSSRKTRHPPSMSPLTAAPAAMADPAPTSIHVARCFRRLFTGLSRWGSNPAEVASAVPGARDYCWASPPFFLGRVGVPGRVGDHDGGSLAGKLSIDASSMMSSSDIASSSSTPLGGSADFRGFWSSDIVNLLVSADQQPSLPAPTAGTSAEAAKARHGVCHVRRVCPLENRTKQKPCGCIHGALHGARADESQRSA